MEFNAAKFEIDGNRVIAERVGVGQVSLRFHEGPVLRTTVEVEIPDDPQQVMPEIVGKLCSAYASKSLPFMTNKEVSEFCVLIVKVSGKEVAPA